MKRFLPIYLGLLLLTPALSAAPIDRAILAGQKPPTGAVWLETLGVGNIAQSQGDAKAAHSANDRSLTLKQQVFAHGIGVRARACTSIALNRGVTRFATLFGVDDSEGEGGAVALRAFVDGVMKFDSGVVRRGDAPKLVDIDLRGAKKLELDVLPVEDETHPLADFAGAALFLAPSAPPGGDDARPALLPVPRAQLTLPEWVPAPLKPEINGPRVMGISPGKPFLYRIPATGQTPLSFGAQNLPMGLSLDAKTGIIAGTIAGAGSYSVTLSARNALGSATRPLRIECGPNKLALTPIMGWNAWNVFGDLVTAKDVAAQADSMVSSGLAARGYNTLIVDDTWQSLRLEDGTIGSNRRFGSMKALADYVHSKGLKIGLLSSGTPMTCSGFAGSAGHETQDAALYARWGIDLLKYDWCPDSGSKNNAKRADVVAAYKKMRAALDATNRDIVLQMVTYGFGGPAPDLGAETGAQMWRTSEGMIDTSDSVSGIAVNSGGASARSHPGGWSDFGPLLIGRFTPRSPHFSNLSLGAQKLQMTVWAIGGSPLILSCDLSQLDPSAFYRVATPLLMNPEVLAINQDEAFKAPRVTSSGDTQGWSRPLSDGTFALAVLNRASGPNKITTRLSDMGLPATATVRDVWGRRDLGTFHDTFTTTVAARSAALFIVRVPTG